MSNKIIQNKHIYSISGREITATKARKRNRSSEEELERKKGRCHSVGYLLESEESDTLTEINEDSSVTDLRERLDLLKSDEMDEKNFIKCFVAALRNDEISGLMAETFEKTVDKKLKPVIDSIDSVKAENKERDERVKRLEDTCSSLEAQVDEIEQSKRNKNIIISGLEEQNCNQEGALNFLKSIPGVDVTIFDIDYVLKLRSQANNNSNTHRVRVVLQNKEKKTEIMKAKKRLGAEVKTWLNDDLTPYRARLGYQARQSVKAGHLQQSWTFDGKVFIKKHGHTSGTLVRSIKDLPASN